MEYKKLNAEKILVRLDKDDEIVAALAEIAAKESITLAMVQGLGAVKKVVMGAYNVPRQEYNRNTIEGVFEMLSLTGTMDTMKGEPYSHFHIVVGDENGRAWGGHLNEAIVSATAEIIVTLLPGNVDREKNGEVGLNVWKFQ